MKYNMFKWAFGLTLITLLWSVRSYGTDQQEKPNVLIIIADDCTFNDLPLYGGENVETPHIDHLASEGMTFNQAYLSMSMSAPCRAELYTGMYPAQNGVCWNHAPARQGRKSIVQHLGDLGYRVGLAGKVHASPREVFPFEMVEGLERGCVSETSKFDEAGMRRFINKDEDQPFCLVAALITPHIPWTVGDPSHFDEDQLQLPPNLADTKDTREEFAKYLAEIEVLDQQVGRTLQMLEETGEADNTIVIFTSEQGSQFPGCKWTNWNTGIHTGFVVRWPGKVDAGVRTDALIQYADVLPTLMDAASGEPDQPHFNGTSFLPVLLGQKDQHREYAYFMHNNVPEGPPYPIRSITDGKYHYIRNLTPDRLYMEKHLMGRMPLNKYWPSWQFDAAKDTHTYRLIERYMKRPKEQLYLMSQDPYELKNLENESSHQNAQKRLSGELDRWMKRQGDPGIPTDTWKEYKSAREGDHFEQQAD